MFKIADVGCVRGGFALILFPGNVPDNNNAKSGKFSDLNELSGSASVSDTLLLQTRAGSCCRPRGAVVEASG